MDLSTYEGRAAQIAEWQRQAEESDAAHQEFLRQQKEHEARISDMCAKMVQSINEPLYQLIRDIRAMK